MARSEHPPGVAAFPLVWPVGWKRTPANRRRTSRFCKEVRDFHDDGTQRVQSKALTIADGCARVDKALGSIYASAVVLSSNVPLRNDGRPRSGERAPVDPGVAVYWLILPPGGGFTRQSRVMAIDEYDTVADNLAAVAATLVAMRAIERHGGAIIMERAFSGFTALPGPETGAPPWRDVLGLSGVPDVTLDMAKRAYRELAAIAHPDKGGTDAQMSRLNVAMDAATRELSP